ncbi:uncharacterized protein At4g02000-like [Hibiscus syriacus]|uniref:uncharacterized protein At4g02000-like n=1 Tax=Hibiscus syriacus TaxID=106335 RepID=UPI001923CEEB|nr:uncharacterized protein At4g02000-like [Hibiscus syriacus]
MDWRKLFQCSSNHQLQYFPPNERNGTLLVHPLPEVFEGGISEWKYSLVGQFLGSAPNFSSLQRIIDGLWKNPLKGSNIQVSYVGPNLYLFSFESDTARDWVMENGPWHFYNKPLILRKWEPNMQKLHFDLSRIPIWVHLFNVPLELFSNEGLSYIASAIGYPLSMDSITASKTRLEYAKVCVEVGVSEVIPKSIDVMLNNGLHSTVTVEIPWLPPSCKSCNTFGHNTKSCKVNPSPSLTAQVWRKNDPLASTTHAPVNTCIDFAESSKITENVSAQVSSTKDSGPGTGIVSPQGSKNESAKISSPKDSGTGTGTPHGSEPSQPEKDILSESASILSPNCPLSEPEIETAYLNPSEIVICEQKSSSPSKRGRGRPPKSKTKNTLAGSSNRFEILKSFEEAHPESEMLGKKPRAAASGVAELIKDLKAKKKSHHEKAKSAPVGSKRGDSVSSPQST